MPDRRPIVADAVLAFFRGGPNDGMELVIESPTLYRLFPKPPKLSPGDYADLVDADRPVLTTQYAYRLVRCDELRRCALYEYEGERA